jgi:hypothetical protein
MIMNNLLHVLRRTDFTYDCALFMHALMTSRKIDLCSCIIDLIASIYEPKNLALAYGGVIRKVLTHFKVPW